MEAIIYFGRQSVNVDTWNSVQIIDSTVEKINDFFDAVTESKYASIKVPHDWAEEVITAQNLWEKLLDICQGQMDLMTHIYQALCNQALTDRLDKNVSINEVANQVTNENPNTDNTEYYGVAKISNQWANIPTNYHISNADDLNDFALNFLSNFPIDEGNYSSRCHSLFPNLVFHNDFSKSLETHGMASKSKSKIIGISNFSIPVTKSLAALNSIILEDKTPKAIMAEISDLTGFHCSEQGKNKSHLTYKFTLEDDYEIDVKCEFHLKFNSSNNEDNIKHYQRIYFGINEVRGIRKIFVAHSGQHL